MSYFAGGFELLITSNIQKFNVSLSLPTIPLLARSLTNFLHTNLAASPVSCSHPSLQHPLPDLGEKKHQIYLCSRLRLNKEGLFLETGQGACLMWKIPGRPAHSQCGFVVCNPNVHGKAQGGGH